MAQQQPRRDNQFQNIARTDDQVIQDRVRKNDEFATGTASATDPVAVYAYGSTGDAGGYGRVPGAGGMPDTRYEYTSTAVYGTTTPPPAPGFGGGQWGQEANTDQGAAAAGDTGGNKNMGRDQK